MIKLQRCVKLTSESQDLIVEVDNQIGAKVGDHVEVSMETVKVMKATMLAYILPLIFLVAGTAISFGVLNAISFKGPLEVISGLCGLLCTFLSYLYLRKNDKKYRDSRDYIPEPIGSFIVLNFVLVFLTLSFLVLYNKFL